MKHPSALTSLVDWFLPPKLRDAGPDTVRRAKLCIAYNLTVPLWAPAFALLLWKLGQPAIGAIILSASLFTPVPLLVLRRTGSLVLTGNLIASVMSVTTVLCTWLEGGLGAPGLLWFPLVPILSTLIAGFWTGVAWTTFNVLVLAAFYAFRQTGFAPDSGLSADTLALLHMSLGASATIVGFLLASLFESLKTDALGHLERANEALALARDQAEAATRAKSDFVAMMSHEIRTPIHGIFGMTELALDTTDDAERRDFLNRTRACADTLLAIINDILDFSRIEAGRLDVVRSTFDPRALMEGVLDTLAAHANAKTLDLLGWVDDGVPARLSGDSGRLRQVLVNLAGNAVKFTDDGTVEISLAAESQANGTVLLRGVVEDTGIGIAAEQQTAIFEAFSQVADAPGGSRGGTGLGLAITRRLVGLMGGDISLESTAGVGSRFAFTVTVTPAPAPQEEQPVSPRALAGRRILVIDPNAASRRLLAAHLVAAGATTVQAADPTEARGASELVRGHMDAVLLNPPVAEVERRALLAALGEIPRLAATPRVALTPRPLASEAGLRAQCVALAPKPVKRATLVAAFEAAFGQRVAAAS